ncbi:hypothetical protein C5N99_09445 [Treponema medium]|uniref:hypothetical protein n=1 Tax=Treponema medium TaxID=58231 RepID=UPI00197FAAD7|nr:hypothetical protein [Treponema medium]QSH92813.1 hypothetical protein C5N99_09445 [Treponema medium]
MKRFAFCFFILAVAFCQSPFGAADGIELTDIPVDTTSEIPVDITPEIPANTAPTDTTQAEKVSAETAKDSGTASSAGEAGKETGSGKNNLPSAGNVDTSVQAKEAPAEDSKSGAKDSGTVSPTADAKEKETESNEDTDSTFASIHSKGLAVADGNKWYYETFDRQGRSAFGVLYEDGAAIEKTVWTYQGAARYPEQKKILRKESSEIFRYNEKGKELSIERYEGKNLISKTENVYNAADKLIEQTITTGKNTDRSVWEFVKDKALSQTKYRNGKKTAFIELDSTPHIVHLYVDDKEVYVGEEP